MNNLLIEGNDTLPTFDLNVSGLIKVEGKALPEDATKVFTPVFNWIAEFKNKDIVFDVNLYYFNTAVSKQLYEMFSKAVENESVESIMVKWRYEEGDDDSHESGLIYKDELPAIDFEFYEYAEV